MLYISIVLSMMVKSGNYCQLKISFQIFMLARSSCAVSGNVGLVLKIDVSPVGNSFFIFFFFEEKISF